MNYDLRPCNSTITTQKTLFHPLIHCPYEVGGLLSAVPVFYFVLQATSIAFSNKSYYYYFYYYTSGVVLVQWSFLFLMITGYNDKVVCDLGPNIENSGIF